MTLDKIIHSLEDQAQDKDSLADGDPESIFIEDATALREAARIIRNIEIYARMKVEQHEKLLELREKLNEVIEHKPADSGSKEEDEIWNLADYLFELLNDFFEGETGKKADGKQEPKEGGRQA